MLGRCARDDGTPSPAAVVRAWSKALNGTTTRRPDGCSPSTPVSVQGPLDGTLKTQQAAAVFNSTLPCAGRIVAMEVKGDTVLATFVLGHRPKHKCDGPGQKAAAVFVVKKGKITLWEQVAVPPANDGGPPAGVAVEPRRPSV